ncbi:tetratricopeptide repeat protein [Shewanella aestuarii]|uniref:tetratricopeptide repeat protein n=1 Tax=Shewanella aestuarii TaxID=1028752 RepID=UPI001FCB6435|nr:tetratricopeptide repeat protein [Shewanella aestuarii]
MASSVFLPKAQAFSIPQSAQSQAQSKIINIQLKAAQGEPDAQFLLGLMYLSGRFVDQDVTQGFMWVEQAAYQHHFKAQQTLADLSFEGKLVPRNLLKAEKWYLAMSEQGDKWANFRLGFIYAAGGDGVERNCGKALVQFGSVGDTVSLGNVAWILATCPEAEYRDGSKAVNLSLKLLETNENDPTILDNLAAGYAEMGDFTQAVNIQKKAIDALKYTPELVKSDEFNLRLQQYENNQAYREVIPILD